MGTVLESQCKSHANCNSRRQSFQLSGPLFILWCHFENQLTYDVLGALRGLIFRQVQSTFINFARMYKLHKCNDFTQCNFSIAMIPNRENGWKGYVFLFGLIRISVACRSVHCQVMIIMITHSTVAPLQTSLIFIPRSYLSLYKTMVTMVLLYNISLSCSLYRSPSRSLSLYLSSPRSLTSSLPSPSLLSQSPTPSLSISPSISLFSLVLFLCHSFFSVPISHPLTYHHSA